MHLPSPDARLVDGNLAAKLVAAHFTPGVIAAYLRAFGWWAAWRGHLPLREDDVALVPLFLRTLAALGALRGDVATAVAMLNVVYQPRPPVVASACALAAPTRPVSQADLAALLPHCRHPGSRLVLVLLRGMGLREREALQLRGDDVDWPAQRLYVGAGDTGRWLGLTPPVAPELARALAAEPRGPLARACSGQPLARAVFRDDLAVASQVIGLASRVSPGSLRLGYGTQELHAGRDLRLLLARMGVAAGNGLVPQVPGGRGPPAVTPPGATAGEHPPATGHRSSRSLGGPPR